MVNFEGDIQSAYDDVRSDKSETNWLLLNYPTEKDTLALAGTGKGGLAEFTDQLKDDQAAFGYLRIVVGNDELSQRAKFVLISWCGRDVKVMRKAKLSVHIAEVKSIIKAIAIEIAASSKEDIRDEEVKKLLRKAMGANYDAQHK
ncbi:hypothetical protein HDU89_001642 [Geranomyces variabilis]|nr:hypothetical protein BDZ88DRAFT_428622 [Geranomyces variabilis]KAJ3136429.1 hypothetical protein HDU90_003136 [Geranomyces variabilis]KAJ3151995.1 hypothetical protein HDU89_001642 [Geranomyces variabilis]KAJ3162196.1 hypothetical protein HDU88_007119 [Geranomyces variabilis]